MDIKIDEKAKKYIRENSRNKSVAISFIKSGGWNGVYKLVIKPSLPSRIEEYNVYNIEDIDVYILKQLVRANAHISISLSEFFWRKSLKLKGIRI